MRWLCAALLCVATPAAAKVVITPPSLRLGGDVRARVVWTRGGEVEWRASLGRVVDGEYDPGPRRAPGHVLIAALAPGGELLGAGVLRLIGKGTLPTHTSPGASVTVEIGAERFGPVVADGSGDATVPVVVPPELTTATVASIDVDGMSTRRVVDLPLSPVPRALLLAPRRLGPGASGTVTVLAVDARGAWRSAAAAPPVVTVQGAAQLEPFRAVEDGRWEATLRAAARDEPGTLRLDATVDGQRLAAAEVTVDALVARPPPPPPPPPPPLEVLVGARGGAASAFGGLVSMAAVVDLGLARGDGLAGGVELAVARGSDLDQLAAALVGRVRLTVASRTRLELLGGAGIGHASSDAGSDTAPYLFAGAALTLAIPGGDLVLDLRWADLRYDDFVIGVDGNALGLVATAGYRLRL